MARWCDIFGTCGNKKKARRAQRRAAEAAAAAAAAERQRQQQLEQQRQAQAAQQARQAQAQAAALAAQRQAEAQALASKRIGAATQARQDIIAQREASQQFVSDVTQAGAEEALGATVGQPGIARTQLTASTTPLGGYSGTSPTDVSPTSLNI